MVPIPVAAVMESAPPAYAVASLPACRAAQLSLTLDGEDGAFNGMSHSGTLLVLRNIGPAPCRVPGLPRITFAGPDGRPLPIARRPPAGMHPGPVVLPVAVAPGAEVTAGLRWVSGEVYDPSRCFSPATIAAAVGGETVRAAFAGHICGRAGAPATFEQGWLEPDARAKP